MARFAIVTNSRWGPGSIDLKEYLRQLAAFGFEPLLVCRGHAELTSSFPVHVCSPEELRSPDFFRGLGLEAAILFNWLHGHEIVDALKRAGVHVVLRGDSDGQVSVRTFPRATFRNSVTWESGLVPTLRNVKHWAMRYARLDAAEMADTMACIDLADEVVVESDHARQNLLEEIRRHGPAPLGRKVRVVPHFVDASFLQAEVRADKRKKVFCGGRWFSTQKNGPLMARTIAKALGRDPSIEFVITGAGGDPYFRDLERRFPQVRHLGPVPHDRMRGLLEDCRVFLSSARWESFPIAALEALALGCSVAAPPVAGYVDICEEGRSGTLARRYGSTSLADALLYELNLWETGRRNARVIADGWRPRLSSERVIRALVEGVHPRRTPRT